MSFVEITQGASPIVLGFPHTGTHLPDDVAAKLNPLGRDITDTDWHVHELYAGLLAGASSVRTTVHRYVIDCNRDPSGESLYPGQNTTELCPTTDFDGKPLYQTNQQPTHDEITERTERYHKPYHQALEHALQRAKDQHGYAILFDCHSIRSEIPFLFEGKLPDFCIGTNNGETCHADLEAIVVQVCSQATGYSHVLNGRFKGGWTTRHYGQPEQNVHAIQLELAQSTYMQETAPWRYDVDKAEALRVHLEAILQGLDMTPPQNLNQ